MYRLKNCFLLLILILCFEVDILCAAGYKQTIHKIYRLVENGAVLLNDENGKELISYNAHAMLVPASIIKILTAAVALDILGKEYRFKTGLYTDSMNNLIIKGWGDPYLISEEIELIVNELKQKGITQINSVILDHSSFDQVITIPGISRTLNPYDALNGALMVNFNTIMIKRDADGNISSAEQETPLTPLALKKGSIIRAGTAQRINLSKNKTDCLQYVGELFSVFLKNSGVAITQEAIDSGITKQSWAPILEHRNSRQLEAMLEGLLKYSNNFIANQIFLTIGAEKAGYPATIDKSTAIFREYCTTELQIPADALVQSEGSGISRSTRLTGAVMMKVMEKFRIHARLLTEKNGVLVKSGTLCGVSNYAGYIKTEKGLRPFVIILNQKRSYRDDILELLKSYTAE